MSETSETMDEARKAAEGGMSDRLIERLAERMGSRAGVHAVFGEPIERGEVTVVPVARVRWFFGAGTGSGPVQGTEGGAVGSGSGGGGGASGEPVGYLEIGPSGSIFQPITPPYPSALFLLAAGITSALILRALARLIRG